jgi:glutamate synthase (NADPH/NADH) small chain
MRGCPAHNDIPAFIDAVRNRDLILARKVLARITCMPEVCSRVCDWASQCEGGCNWALAGREPVAIGKLERYVADNTPDPVLATANTRGKGLSVGIIGSGPAGVAAALELAAAGAKVTIYERDPDIGGVMRWGIPSYILPDSVVNRSLKRLRGSGTDIHADVKIAPEEMPRLLQMHDAVIAALGAPVAEHPEIPGLDLKGVVDATSFLAQVKQSLAAKLPVPELLGARVIVLGGSNTALDVARSAIRAGAKPVVVHRREERFSRARPDEIEEAKKEGVEFRFASNVSRLVGDEGKLKKVELVRTHQNRAEMDPAVVRGSEDMAEADIIVLATGYRTDRAFSSLLGKLPLRRPASDSLVDRRWLASGITADGNQTGRLAWEREYGLRSSVAPRGDRLWVVGDALVGPSSVVASMAQGRFVARAILEKHPQKSSAKT